MAQQVVSVEELRARFEELFDFVCAEESEDNEVVVMRPDGEGVVIVPLARYVAVRLALGTYKRALGERNQQS